MVLRVVKVVVSGVHCVREARHAAAWVQRSPRADAFRGLAGFEKEHEGVKTADEGGEGAIGEDGGFSVFGRRVACR